MTAHWTTFCKAAPRVPGRMNKTEQAYADYLTKRLHAGEILDWKFEPFKLRLADNTFYSIDFAIVRADGIIELHEVKGAPWADDARVKIKVAAEAFPWFVFRGIRKGKAGWLIETFSRDE
jgi:hypothetical protein